MSSSHFPRHILLNRIKDVCIVYRPAFLERYGRHPNINNNVISADDEVDLFKLLGELCDGTRNIILEVDYTLIDEGRTGVDIIRDFIAMVENDPNLIPPNAVYIQKHPLEITDLCKGLVRKLEMIRQRRLNLS